MINSRVIWEPKDTNEFLERENYLDLPNIRYNINKVIEKAYEHKIIKDKECHPSAKFSDDANKLIGSVYPKMCQDIVSIAFARSGCNSLTSSEFIRHASDLIVVYIPPKDDIVIKKLSETYNCASPSEVLVGLAARVEEFSLENEIINKSNNSLVLNDCEITRA